MLGSWWKHVGEHRESSVVEDLHVRFTVEEYSLLGRIAAQLNSSRASLVRAMVRSALVAVRTSGKVDLDLGTIEVRL